MKKSEAVDTIVQTLLDADPFQNKLDTVALMILDDLLKAGMLPAYNGDDPWYRSRIGFDFEFDDE